MNNSVPKKLQTVYFQNLDAARFIAAFAVLLLHFSNEVRGLFPYLGDSSSFKIIYLFTGKGGLGVDFFFVLSGFLITFLIFQEQKTHGKFHLGYFLVRRTLRIWPLYFSIGIVGFIIFPAFIDGYFTRHEPLYYFLFLANFDEIWNGANDTVNFLTSPWSVAVEEQFYLFWGIVLSIGFRLRKMSFPLLLILLYVISFIFSWINKENEAMLYLHTLAVCQDILMGAFLGWSVFKGLKWVDKIQSISKLQVFTIYLLGFAIILAKNKLFQGDLILLERFVLSFFFAFIIIEQIGGKHSLFKLGRIKLFTYLGKISYGIYMYHLVVMYLLVHFIDFKSIGLIPTLIIFGSASLLFTYAVSALSYRFIESKFLALKPKVKTE